MAKKKEKKKAKEPRNMEAVSAHFRLAGSMRDKRKKREDDKGKQERTQNAEWE